MKGNFWVVLGFISLALFIGAMGNIEICDHLPIDSVILAIVSFGYIMAYVIVSAVTSNYSQEEFDKMQEDLDRWCFGDKKEKKK